MLGSINMGTFVVSIVVIISCCCVASTRSAALTGSLRYGQTGCQTNITFVGQCQRNEIVCEGGTYFDGLCNLPTSTTSTPPGTPRVRSNIYHSCCIEGNDGGYPARMTTTSSTTSAITTPPPATTCPASALPSLDNAEYTPQEVSVGETVTYTCVEFYRLAPSTATSTDQVQTVTCQEGGAFTALQFTCVYRYPQSCRDYYARDELFDSALISCQDVTIDPEGPDTMTNPNTPPASMVQCCKTSPTDFCAEISTSSGSSYSIPATACNIPTSVVTPTTDYNAPLSGACDTETTVGYPVNDAEITAMINSVSGYCTQVTSISCQFLADSLSLALKMNGETSGFMYGTNAFTPGSSIDLSTYEYAGAPCDCDGRNDFCLDGCICTKMGIGIQGSDTITKNITAANPAYVTNFQVTQHDTTSTPISGSFAVSVGAIQCCEIF